MCNYFFYELITEFYKSVNSFKRVVDFKCILLLKEVERVEIISNIIDV